MLHPTTFVPARKHRKSKGSASSSGPRTQHNMKSDCVGSALHQPQSKDSRKLLYDPCSLDSTACKNTGGKSTQSPKGLLPTQDPASTYCLGPACEPVSHDLDQTQTKAWHRTLSCHDLRPKRTRPLHSTQRISWDQRCKPKDGA